MKTKWYILKNNSHFGPYTESELEDLFKTKQINADSILKKVGGGDQTFKLSSFIKTKTPEEKRSESTTVVANSQKFFQENKNLFKVIPALFLPLFILGLMYLSFRSDSKFELNKPKVVSSKAFKKVFTDLNKKKKSGETDWRFLKSENNKKLWLTTNLPGESDVIIKFRSIPKKILGNIKTEFTIKAKVKNYMAELNNNMNFIHGDKVIPGHYQYFISLNKNSQSISQRIFGSNLQVKDFIKGNILLGAKSSKEMKNRLAKFHGAKKIYKSHATQDIQMKYQTLASIAKNITSDLKKILPKMSTKRKKEFVKLYQRKYGAFFTSFVIENEKQFRNLTKSSNTMNTEMVAHYSSLSRIAKNLGLISIEAMEALETKDRSQINQSFKKFDRMIELSNNKLKILSKGDSLKVQL